MKRVLITGITGFVGSHLAEYYHKYTPCTVYGLIRNRCSFENIEGIKSFLKFYVGDLGDAHSIESAIKEIKPTIIHHLGAQSFVPISWSQPSETIQTNIVGSLNLFEAVRRHSPESCVHVASTSEVYGGKYSLITEETLPEPSSPYGVSKLAMDRLAAQYVKSHKLDIKITRAFNHTGPRRDSHFVTSSFAKQIAAIKGEGTIKVGDLTAKRDWSDVRDVVKGYVAALDYCDAGIPYNISRQESFSVQYVLDTLIRISEKKIRVEQDPNLMRPSDIQELLGMSGKFRTATKWKNEIPFEQTLKDLYFYWVGKLKS